MIAEDFNVNWINNWNLFSSLSIWFKKNKNKKKQTNNEWFSLKPSNVGDACNGEQANTQGRMIYVNLCNMVVQVWEFKSKVQK